MLTSLFLLALRNAVLMLLSRSLQGEIMKLFNRVKSAVEAVLAKYPTSALAGAVVVANFVTKFGFRVSATQVVLIASAVAVFAGALVRHSVKTAARKPASK